MSKRYRVAGYVKLAKLWERSRQSALQYHRAYYEQKYKDATDFECVGVYVDITGQKRICKRPQMLSLLRACTLGKIDCIAAQTKGYLTANSQELCYLLKFLFDLPVRVELITEDENYRIDTILDYEHQREALRQMAEDYVALDEAAYNAWKHNVLRGMNENICTEKGDK